MLPESLQSLSLSRQQALTGWLHQHHLNVDASTLEALTKTLTISDYAHESIQHFPDLMTRIVEEDFLQIPLTPDQARQDLQDSLANCSDEASLFQGLRQFRRRHQVRIIHRDLNGLSPLKATLKELTLLADLSIQAALDWQHKRLVERYGEPMGKSSKQPQSLIVIAMGKQGAGELNLSSDIDLIFAFKENGDTQGPKSISNQEFFTKLGQALIQSLDKNTVDGFVYRVDMRLRPYGQSGPLAMNFPSLENYYHEQGRDWERYAMIKARAVTGSPEHVSELMSIMRPFSYRKYVDFGAFESLREMKKLIQQETIRRNLDTNVKLGSGGIREVEFIAQAFQLIRGGQEQELQQPNIFKVYEYLKSNGYLPPDAVDELLQAYVFLRNSEHVIQALRDEQSQTLPDNDLNQQRMAYAMGYPSWDEYRAALNDLRQKVAFHFNQIVAEEQEDTEESDISQWQTLWHDQDDAVCLVETDNTALHTLLDRLRQQAQTKMQAIGQQRLDKAMPLILQALWDDANKDIIDCPLTTLERIVPLIEAILRRTAYLVLLTENPQAMRQLVRLCGASPWIAQSITQAPILLDELLHPAHLFNPGTKQDKEDDLTQRLLRIPEDDLEEQMDALRHFAQAHKLQTAASDITGVLPLMKVSDHLTWLAEVILEKSLYLAWHQMVEKYGYPTNEQGEAVLEPDFLILGYGKVGGIELSYGSDLDMVFLHGGVPNRYTTGVDGKREQENGVFYTRMAQRLIHILNTTTRAGQLYEVDMRLRPSGANGMIAASLKAFEQYQLNEAWTWEHQALIRARVIAGKDTLGDKFSEIRQKVLTKDRNPQQLLQEVREMRQKMRDNLGSQSMGNAEYHLKQDAGGIVDIEFLVQYLVLANCPHHPDLLTWTDNIRLLETLAAQTVLDQAQCDALKQAYIAYRSLAHRRALQNQKLLLSPNELDQVGLRPHIDKVNALWETFMNSTQ